MRRPPPKSIAVLACLVALLVPVAGCRTTPPSPYLRVVVPNGRVYYAYEGRTLHSEAAGFITFRDLVTRETVKLKNGQYVARECTQHEVDVRQQEYLDDPSRPPMMDAEMAKDH